MIPHPVSGAAASSSGSGDAASTAETGGSSELDPLLKKPNMCDMGCVDWFAELTEHFGYKLLALLFVVQHLMRGFVDNLCSQSQPYIYRAYKTPAPQMQIYQGITQLPWAMKPIIGLLSDTVPILGYNKGPYMLLATVGGALSFLAVGSMGHPGAGLSLGGLVMGFFFCNLQLSTCDILTEAKYSEKIRTSPAHGPSILTYVWFGMQVGGLAGIVLSGFVIERGEAHVTYLISVPLALAVAAPVLLGYVEEEKQTEQDTAARRAKFAEQKEACFLCVLIFFLIICLTGTLMLTHNVLLNALVAIASGVVMIIAFAVVLSPVIARANTFSILQSSLSWSTAGAGFYFYTDTEEQYPEGPHFSEFFYTSVIGTVGACLSLAGIMTYQRYLSKWKYRELIVMTNLVTAFFSLCDLMMYTRLNVKLGIPDHMFVLSSTVLGSVVNQWMWMPQVVIMAYLCPRGMEATMYALLAGCHNLGNTIGSACGALMLQYLGCRPDGSPGESAQFQNLWVAGLVATLLPTITTVLTVHLLPDAHQDEKILSDDAAMDATSGSLWRRWNGYSRIPGE